MPLNDVIAKTMEVLEGLGAKATPVGSDSDFWQCDFPLAEGADYSFSVYVYGDGEVEVSATRTEAPVEEYFWSQTYELEDFDSIEQLHHAVHQTLVDALSHSTRITQRSGLLFSSFECEIHRNELWESIGQNSGLRVGGFRSPSIPTRKLAYTAGPVIESRDNAA